MSKLISEFKIGFDDETKAVINALNDKLDEVARGLAAKNESHADGLLAAMQAEAANDAPQPELKELGQWVFEGQDEKWKSAAINSDGRAFRHNLPSSHVYFHKGVWRSNCFDQHEIELIDGAFDTSDFLPIQIDRETVNDVDYLSESAPEIQGMEASDIIIDEYDWQFDSVPQITQADMQLIFIKNLSNVLIQRMQTMDRFSDDDYHIGAEKLMSWDIVIDQASHLFGVVVNNKDNILSAFFLKAHCESTGGGSTNNFHANSLMSRANRTITEAELPAFREALEACYV